MLIKLFEICPNIEELYLDGQFSNINLDSFIHLKKLSLYGEMLDGFNFDLFANICNQLEDLEIALNNLNNKIILKLFYGHNFRNLLSLDISKSKNTRLEKTLFDGFPILHSLNLSENVKLKKIDKDAFSNLKNLTHLYISYNNLSEIDPEMFSCLKKLKNLDLRYNKLAHFDLKIMDYFVNLKEIDLRENPIVNKQEIMDYFKQSKITFTL